jgi:hypothetical protein
MNTILGTKLVLNLRKRKKIIPYILTQLKHEEAGPDLVLLLPTFQPALALKRKKIQVI